MGYAIYISHPWNDQGERIPIDLNHWRKAIASIDNLRLTAADIRGLNPRTGEVLQIANRIADVEMVDPNSGEWIRTFFWYDDGHVIFSPPDDFDLSGNSTRIMAFKIAQSLGVEVRGEEGELYF